MSMRGSPRLTGPRERCRLIPMLSGFGRGAGFSLGSGGGAKIVKNLDLSSPGATALIGGVVNHSAGGVGAMANELVRPGGDQSRANLVQTFGTGFLAGARGPTVSSHRAP